jgi:hypothetical protein
MILLLAACEQTTHELKHADVELDGPGDDLKRARLHVLLGQDRWETPTPYAQTSSSGPRLARCLRSDLADRPVLLHGAAFGNSASKFCLDRVTVGSEGMGLSPPP